jgi:hypothetical protein
MIPRIVGLILSVAAAFVFLTINVGTRDVGGPLGTLVVSKGTSEAEIRQTQQVLRYVGFGWGVIAFGCLVSIRRNAEGARKKAGAQNPAMLGLGVLLSLLGMVGGLLLAVVAGRGSPAFTRFFGYCVGCWMLGTMLVWLGRPSAIFSVVRDTQQRRFPARGVVYSNPYKMIMMKCDVTGRPVKTGINSAYFDQWGGNPPALGASFKCPECGQTHHFDRSNTWLAELD